MRKCLSYLLLAVFLVLTIVSTAFAATPRFNYADKEAGDSDLVYTVKPGVEHVRTFTMYNLDEEREIEMFVKVKKRGLEGQVDANWFSVDTDELTVDPSGSKDFNMVIMVPEGTPDGTYTGVILASLVDYAGNSNGESEVKVTAAKGILVDLVVDSTLDVESAVGSDEVDVEGEDDVVKDAEKEVKEKTTSLYSYVQEYFDIVLLVIIGLLIIKMYFMGKPCKESKPEKKSKGKKTKGKK